MPNNFLLRQELKAQFSNDKRKFLLREQIKADLLRLEQRAHSFVRQLSDLVQIDILGQKDSFRFFRRLLNYDPWRIEGLPTGSHFLDYQVPNSDVEAERDHLRVGDHYVRVLTIKEAISETKPLVLKQLLEIQANFCVVSEWVPIDNATARKEITKRRRHFNVSKSSFISSVRADAATVNPRDVLIDESKQADIENLGDCLRVLGDGQSLGEFSLTIVLYAEDRGTLDRVLPDVVRIFTSADGTLFSETYNQLNAYFATIPGNYRHNLRRHYLLNSNYADISFLFTQTAAGILRKARQCCPNTCLRPRAFNNDGEEDLDCEKLIKFLSKELLPLIDGSLNDWVRIVLKRNCRAVGLKEVLVDVKTGSEDLERSLKALHGIFLCRLV